METTIEPTDEAIDEIASAARLAFAEADRQRKRAAKDDRRYTYALAGEVQAELGRLLEKLAGARSQEVSP